MLNLIYRRLGWQVSPLLLANGLYGRLRLGRDKCVEKSLFGR